MPSFFKIHLKGGKNEIKHTCTNIGVILGATENGGSTDLAAEAFFCT